MRPEALDPATLEDRTIGPVTIHFGFENGKYPYGNSFSVKGSRGHAMIDPSLGIVARKASLPNVDCVIHSHAHEDHVAGTHLFRALPWHVHSEDALGLESIEGILEIYGVDIPEFTKVIEEDFYYPHGGNEAGGLETFDDGHVFDFGGVTLTVLHTPGHTRGHCCFLIEWGDAVDEKLVYLGDIELTGFGPYYGDAWSNLEDFERSIERLRHVDAQYWLTFHHKGLIESRAQFLDMLESFSAVISDREQRLLEYIAVPRTLAEIVEHRFVYRPGQGGHMVDAIEARSMGMHLARLVRDGRVQQTAETYVLTK